MIKNDEFLKYWLFCCYDPDKSLYIARWHLSDLYSIADISLRIGILYNIVADIDRPNDMHKTQLQRCKETLNINLLRALIINNCNLDKDTMKTVCKGLFRPLRFATELAVFNLKLATYRFIRILLQSGADFYPDTLRYIQGGIEFEMYDEEHGFEDVDWIHNWFHEPPSLRFFCRKAIRNTYGKQLTRMLHDLEYPKALTDYIRTEIL